MDEKYHEDVDEEILQWRATEEANKTIKERKETYKAEPEEEFKQTDENTHFEAFFAYNVKYQAEKI